MLLRHCAVFVILAVTVHPISAAEKSRGIQDRRIQAIHNTLKTAVTVDGFDPNTPLKDALEFLQDRYGTKFIVNAKVLERSGIADVGATPIKLPKLVNVPFQRVIELLLNQVDEKDTVRYRVRPEGIEITTDRGDTLIRGSTIRASADDELELRKLSEIWDKLETPVSLDGFEPNTPLKEALGFMSERYGVTILVDTAAFQRFGVRGPENQPVKLSRNINVPMVHVFWQMLAQCNARLRVRNSILEVVPAAPAGMNMAFSPHGRFLATVSTAGHTGQLIRIWDRRTGHVQHSMTVAEVEQTQLAFTPHDKLALLARHSSEDTRHRLSLWDVPSGKNETNKTLRTAEEPALSPDGKNVAFMAGGTLCVRNVRTGKEWKQSVPKPVVALAFSADGQTLCALDRNPGVSADDPATPANIAIDHADPNTVYIWKAGVTHEATRFGLDRRHGGEDWPVSSVTLSQDARLLATVDSLGRLDLWETVSGRRISRLKTTAITREVAFSPTGRLLAAVVEIGSENAVEVWDLAPRKSLGRFHGTHAGQLLAIAFSPDGGTLAASADDGTPIIWDVSRFDKPAPETELTTDHLENLWDRLLSEDAERGYQAMRMLEASSRTVVPFLKARLKPYATPIGSVVESNLRDLDDEQWVRRNQAEQALLRLGKRIEPRLREELRRPLPSLELRRRIERIVGRFQEPVASPELLRELRAIQVLESVATPNALQLLQRLANGAADGTTTQASRVALERLSPPKP